MASAAEPSGSRARPPTSGGVATKNPESPASVTARVGPGVARLRRRPSWSAELSPCAGATSSVRPAWLSGPGSPPRPCTASGSATGCRGSRTSNGAAGGSSARSRLFVPGSSITAKCLIVIGPNRFSCLALRLRARFEPRFGWWFVGCRLPHRGGRTNRHQSCHTYADSRGDRPTQRIGPGGATVSGHWRRSRAAQCLPHRTKKSLRGKTGQCSRANRDGLPAISFDHRHTFTLPGPNVRGTSAWSETDVWSNPPSRS